MFRKKSQRPSPLETTSPSAPVLPVFPSPTTNAFAIPGVEAAPASTWQGPFQPLRLPSTPPYSPDLNLPQERHEQSPPPLRPRSTSHQASAPPLLRRATSLAPPPTQATVPALLAQATPSPATRTPRWPTRSPPSTPPPPTSLFLPRSKPRAFRTSVGQPRPLRLSTSSLSVRSGLERRASSGRFSGMFSSREDTARRMRERGSRRSEAGEQRGGCRSLASMSWRGERRLD